MRVSHEQIKRWMVKMKIKKEKKEMEKMIGVDKVKVEKVDAE